MSRRQKDTLMQLLPLVVILLVVVVGVGIFAYYMGQRKATETAVQAPVAEEAAVTSADANVAEDSVKPQDEIPPEEPMPGYEDMIPPEEPMPGYEEAAPAPEATVDIDWEAEAAGVTSETDKYGMYRTPEEWASEHGGVFVKRDGNLYSMSGYVPEQIIDEYGVGYTKSARGTGVALLYLYDDPSGVRDEIPTETRHALISSGDFPILEVSKTDEVIGFNGNFPLHNMTLTKEKFVGYTIEASDHTGVATMTYFPIVDHVLVADGTSKDHIGVFDLNENPVKDVRQLNQGATYIFEWYSGADYNEMRMVANCRCYDDSSTETIEIPYELTKSGYVTFDLSGVEPGLYKCEGAVVKIVE